MAKRGEVQTPNKKAYDKVYRQKSMLSIAFRLSRSRDAELIEIYESIPNKMEWFRECLTRYKGNVS